MDLAGSKAYFAERVKRMVLVDTGEPVRDPAALRQAVAACPAPVFVCGSDVGETLTFPAARLDEAFGWAPMHPVADAYRAYRPIRYDAPLWDLAALYFTLKPDAPFFRLSEPGGLTVSEGGGVRFVAGQGNVRRVSVDPASRDAAINTFLEILSAQPPAPPAGRGRG
jgi:hypothetical protein